MLAAVFKLHLRGNLSSKAVAAVCGSNALLPKRNFCSDAAAKGSRETCDAGNGSDLEKKVDLTTNGDQYDIAIVGGGMVGLALACALSSTTLTKQLSVAIIDSNPALRSREIFKRDCIPDPRVSTVTPATISFFKDIGAWDYVQKQRHTFFDQMQVWDYTGLGFTRYNARDVGKDYLGCVVENKVLSNSLLLCLENADLEKTIHSARLASMTFQSPSPSGTVIERADSKGISSEKTPVVDVLDQVNHGRLVKLELSDGKTLYAKLVVGADGAKSHVREIAGVKTTGWKYSQSAVICTVEHPVENYCAWQRFLPLGPIALLPIGDKFSNIVWTMSPDESSKHKLMNEIDFVKAVNQALDYGYGPNPESGFLDQYIVSFPWLREEAQSTKESFQVPPKIIDVVSERMAFPLSLMHAHDYASRRIVLVGDAAHTVHPLAGQGVNLGFGDASVLSKVIAEGLLVGADVGELTLLKKYERERKTANVAMMALLDGFQKAYSIDLGPVNVLRAAAFHTAQYIGPLKRNIISYAMGEQKWPLFLSKGK